jgi:hypothetical protein
VVVLALTACGSAEVVGTVTEVQGRLCVVRVYLETGQPANSTCVQATGEQLGGVSVGDCVRAEFGDIDPGRVPTAVQVTRLAPQECAPR